MNNTEYEIAASEIHSLASNIDNGLLTKQDILARLVALIDKVSKMED